MFPTKFRFIWQSGVGRRFLKNRPIRNKNCLWWPCLLTNRDDMSNFYRGPFIDVSAQRAHYICVDLGINRYYICAEKEHYNCPQNVPEPFFYICTDYLLFRIYLIYS